MGVPAFFRWLSRKYPSIVVQCDNGVKGQYHFDNLYLDMNGIIHPCSHPENKAAPETEEEMFEAIFEYVEDILKIVKPKKLLYMAVDGVAPRAKMNQQRSRRFRAAQESHDKIIEIQRIKNELHDRGVEVQTKPKEAHFDSNVITPGTQFMINLSEALRSWINKKLSTDYIDKDGIWPKDLVVILSDSSVPGEGEHKIMDFIRRQKSDPEYDANLSHCLYGADADLIMLGLATHEPHFTILREEFKPNQPRPCDLCSQIGHDLKDCTGEMKPPEELPIVLDTEFIYIRLNVLREYLQRESKKCKIPLDFERFIDDWVFMCFFVGNDFLPHLPSLEIRENAIDRLIKIYIYVIENFSEGLEDIYLTKSGIVSKSRVQLIMNELGEVEDEIFRQRQQSELNFQARNKRRKLQRMNEELRWMKPEAISNSAKPAEFTNVKDEAERMRQNYNTPQEKLNAMLVPSGGNGATTNSSAPQSSNKRKLEEDSDEEPEDEVQLYNDGYKARYYKSKFDCDDVDEISQKVAKEYFKGLCWVLLYYYQGCPDWKWFFPYHYAPFASDLKNIEQMEVVFDTKAKPFKPLEQLMSVFPAASSKSLPPSWRNLMTSSESSILDFYPLTFKIDLNGKKAAWMGVALLPFIEESRLFSALEKVYPDLTDEERAKNRLGSHLVFVSKAHPGLSELFKNVIDEDKQSEPIPLLSGTTKLISGKLNRSQYFSKNYNNLYCCEYEDPQYSEDHVFPAELLKRANIPEVVLKPENLEQFDRYNPIIGMNRGNFRGGLNQAGHRMMDNSMKRNNYGNRNNNYGQQNQYYNNNNRQDNYNRPRDNYGQNNYSSNNYRNDNNNGRREYQQPSYQGQGYQSNYSNSSYYNSSQNNYQYQPPASGYSTQYSQYQQPNNNYAYQGPPQQQPYQHHQQPQPYRPRGRGGGQAGGNSIPSYYTNDYTARHPNYNNRRY